MIYVRNDQFGYRKATILIGKLAAMGQPFRDDVVIFGFRFRRSMRAKIEIVPVEPDDRLTRCLVVRRAGNHCCVRHVRSPETRFRRLRKLGVIRPHC